MATNLYDGIYNYIHEPAARHVWKESGWLEDSIEQLIETQALSQAASELPTHRRTWVMKHRHGMCGVNLYIKRWHYRDTAKCPRCGHSKETARCHTD
jgi:hypothetical protein